jgi:hypothetical protein
MHPQYLHLQLSVRISLCKPSKIQSTRADAAGAAFRCWPQLHVYWTQGDFRAKKGDRGLHAIAAPAFSSADRFYHEKEGSFPQRRIDTGRLARHPEKDAWQSQVEFLARTTRLFNDPEGRRGG